MPTDPAYEHSSCELLVTNSCNMDCAYCIAKDLPGSEMGRAIGRKAIDLFVHLAEGCRTVEFVFTGGEPLLEKSDLECLIRYADIRAHRAGMQPYFVLKTNGTILDGEIVSLLQSHNIKAVVSVDGGPQAHNRHRKTAKGKDTHSLVMRNLRILRESQVSCVASMTVHPEAAETVLDNVRLLHDVGIDQIDVGPAYGTVSWTDADVASFVQSLMEVADYMREQNTQGRKLEVGPLFRESEHVGGVLLAQWGCRAGASNLAFLPNGKIAGCSALAMIASQIPDLVLGDVDSGLDQIAVDRMLEVAQARRDMREACWKCDTARDCTGGCLAINYSVTGAAFLPPPIYCNTIRVISDAWCRAWEGLTEVPAEIG